MMLYLSHALLTAAFMLNLTPSFDQSQTLLERKFRTDTNAVTLLDLTASGPLTSWKENGSEAAVATVLVDDAYNQDIVLFAGERPFTYQVLLGRLHPGEHTLRIVFNRKLSAAKASSIKLEDAKISAVDRAHPEYQALSLAPIVYARSNTIGRFTDIPLLMWYETQRNNDATTIRYSIIFSNEDGGTQTSALMSRWGRTTDIEWVYEVQVDDRGKLLSATFQGVEHKTRRFRGRYHDGHPALFVVSDNNNFSDRGRSAIRYAPRPIHFDLHRNTREEIMDRYPWIYQIMTSELHREGKIADESRVGNQMSDPRRYLYFDAESEQRGTAISFAVKLQGNPTWHTSDVGIGYYRIDRSGHFRTTVRLPAGTNLDHIERIAVRCDAAGNPKSAVEIEKVSAEWCHLKAVNKVFFLDDQYQPGQRLSFSIQPLKLRLGEMLEVFGK